MANDGADIVQSLVNSVENGKNHTNKAPPSIYMVPSMFRDQSAVSFNPRVVSIGPLHREDEKLKEFEICKASSVYDLLQRVAVPPEQRVGFPRKETLESCVQKVKASAERIRGCYAEMKTCSADDDLAKMMVMDGCFILEFIYKFIDDRPVVSNMLLQQSIIYDLLLLENQIPFFVLNDIYECTIRKTEGDVRGGLRKFIFPFLKFLHIFCHEGLKVKSIHNTITPHDHILGLLHKCYMPPTGTTISLSGFSSSIRTAVDLDSAGVNIKPNKGANWSMDMEVKLHRWRFWAKPTFRMPVLYIHDYTELVLRNLMAYEQSSLGLNYVTSYVIAIDMLVNSEEDIATLLKSKVLVNELGSNVEAANMINGICKEIAWRHFFYSKQWTILNRYCDGYWTKHVARLRRTYFSSPWSIIALVAGFVLFALTVIQTICSMKEARFYGN